MKAKKKFLIGLLIVAVVVALTVMISAIVCSNSIKVTDYEVSIEGLCSELKIVCISDLHSKEYGKANAKLLSMIAEQTPDAIFADGDMINSDAAEMDIENFIKLLKDLLDIAPVFYSAGNHEVEYIEANGEELLNRIAETGTVVLYDSFVETEIAGNTIRVGGTCGHYRDINWEKHYDYDMQEAIGSTDVPSVVLMHMPENITMDSARENWNADLYISGHTHGGIIRIPFVGGLVAPTQGFFPEYDKGQFLIDDRLNLIITSGLSGYEWVPRVFNRPEICVITLIPET